MGMVFGEGSYGGYRECISIIGQWQPWNSNNPTNIPPELCHCPLVFSDIFTVLGESLRDN